MLIAIAGVALALLAVAALVVGYLAALLFMLERCDRDRAEAWG